MAGPGVVLALGRGVDALGLGFTFFSGAVEAWLVDALQATGFDGDLDAVFGRGQVVTGAAMLGGSAAGGFIASRSSLGVPFALRGLILLVLFAVAFRFMRDIGFTPEPRTSVLVQMRSIAVASAEYGWRVPPVRFLLQALFTGGVAIYAFYALQPYLLELYGDPEAYQVAGLVAAIVAGAQIVGGLAAPSSDGCSGAARPHCSPPARSRWRLLPSSAWSTASGRCWA